MKASSTSQVIVGSAATVIENQKCISFFFWIQALHALSLTHTSHRHRRHLTQRQLHHLLLLPTGFVVTRHQRLPRQGT